MELVIAHGTFKSLFYIAMPLMGSNLISFISENGNNISHRDLVRLGIQLVSLITFNII